MQKLINARNREAKPSMTAPCDLSKFCFRKILDTEFIELIKGIEVHKPSGIPRISTFLLKHSLGILIPQLLHMLNQTIFTCIIPNSWKSAVVTPLYKAGSPGIPGNYRPMPTLPLIGLRLKRDLLFQMHHKIYSKKMISDNVRRVNTRQNAGIVSISEHPTSNKFLNSVMYHGPRLWMDLPSETRNLFDFESFKKVIKESITSVLVTKL